MVDAMVDAMLPASPDIAWVATCIQSDRDSTEVTCWKGYTWTPLPTCWRRASGSAGGGEQ
jgi:hypothetical protein